MSSVELSLKRKLEQARFHLSQLERERHNEFVRECYFSAFLSSVRSVVLYVRSWLEREGKVGTTQDWVAKIKPWEQLLPNDRREKWQCITRLRNDDIHEEPMIPDQAHGGGGYFGAGYFGATYFGGGFFGSGMLKVKNSKSGAEYELFDACKTAVEVAEQLIREHTTL